ncbi:MAG: hypothetical protein NTZ74_06045 [Chloroflexi bacterium]|nr:hypothetical protein [Chloroflexota bacterium]
MAIPEFVLRKLVAPGSLKSKGNGFSFILLNSFAPATIQHFDLFMGEKPIPLESISFSFGKNNDLLATEISPEKPIQIPVGIEIIVSVTNQNLTGIISIKATTKEVGDISFTIAKQKKKKNKNQLKPTILTRFQKAIFANLNIDLEKPIGTVSPLLLGQFIEHLERCIYDGIWTADGSQLRQDTLDLIKQLNPPIIRYPGGNFASGYHWEDGIGPKECRIPRHDAAWQAEESNLVGTDEFLCFCEEIGTEPLLVVNDGSGSAEEAARWVSYCNDLQTTREGRHRAANGHAEPYHVKYWGIGNEVWGPWQIGTTGAGEYTNRLLRFISLMKSVDPSIKIIAVGRHPLSEDPDDPALLWNKEVLTRSGDKIDFLSWHIYQPEKDGWKEQIEANELFQSICAAPLDLLEFINRVEKQISQFSPNKKVMQALDEWNIWLPPVIEGSSMHNVTYTMRDALYTASSLAVFFRNSHTLGMANLAQMVNVLPLIETNSKKAIATAIFYPFVLFNKMESRVFESCYTTPTFSSLPLGENIKAHEKVPFLDLIITTNEDQSIITMLLINRSPERSMKVEFSLPGIPTDALEIAANYPLSSNSFRHPGNIKIRTTKKPDSIDHAWRVVLKPASISFYKFTNIS